MPKDTRITIKLARKYLPAIQALKGITGETEYGKAIEQAVKIINELRNQ
jgi:hypothetical protein